MPSGSAWVWPRPRHVASSVPSKCRLVGGQLQPLSATGLSYPATGSLLWSPSPAPQVQALKSQDLRGIQLTDTTVLQRVPASLGIKLMAYKSHDTEGSDRAYNSSFTGLENNQPQFWPTQKDTAFPKHRCTNVHGISTVTWCQSLRLLMYVCAWHIIFPCNPLLYFLARVFEGRDFFGERKQL